MKKHLYFLLSFFLTCIISQPLAAQDWKWIKADSTGVTAVVTGYVADSVGNTFVSYRNPSSTSDIILDGVAYSGTVSRFVIASYDSAGNFRWAKQFWNSDYSELHVKAIDKWGNIIIGGDFEDSLVIGNYTLVAPQNPDPNGLRPRSAVIAKLDNAGNVLWAKQATGGFDIRGDILDATTDEEGDIHVLASGGNLCFDGFCFSTGQDTKLIMLKLDPQGTVLGAHLENNFDGANLLLDKSGNRYIVGDLLGSANIGGQALSTGTRIDIVVVKYGPSGNVLWVKQFGSLNSSEEVYNASIDAAGNIYIAGRYRLGDAAIGNTPLPLGNAQQQAYLAKINGATGNVMWVQKENYLSNSKAGIHNLQIDKWGNIYTDYLFEGNGNIVEINGTTYSSSDGNSFMIAYDTAGAVRWLKQGIRWNNSNLITTPMLFDYLILDHSGGVYYSSIIASGTFTGGVGTVFDTLNLDKSNGQIYRAKLLDCEVLTAKVVSSVTGNYTICDNSPPVDLKAEATSSGELQYQWLRDGAAIAGATSAVYSTLQTGDYQVVVQNYNGCTDTSAAVTLTIVNQALPTATVTAPAVTEVCRGGSVALAANTGSGYSYQWKRGNSFITGATDSVFSATESGDYSVVITNSFGCSQVSQPVQVTVEELPFAYISAAGSTTICQNQSVALVAPPGQGLQYQWQLNGTDIAGATAITHAASQAGDYRVVVTNSNGCSNTSNEIEVTVTALPGIQINVNGPTTICANSSVSISTPFDSKYSYQWQRNGVDIPGQTSTSLLVNQPGDYRVVLTGNTSNLCSNISQVTTVSVDPGPVAALTAAGPTALCPGGSVSLVANSGSGYSYRWYRNGSLISGETASLLTATTAGNYTVEIENSRGCFNASAAVAVTNAALPTAAIQTPAATAFCAGESMELEAVTGAGLSYSWIHNGVEISGATDSVLQVTAGGAYQLKVVNSSGCEATSSPAVLTETALPVASIASTTDTVICAGSNAGLFTTASGSYEWLLNGAQITGATNASYPASQAGAYQVVVTNTTGCSDTSRVITVVDQSIPAVAITVGGPAVFCTGSTVQLAAPPHADWQYQWLLNGSDINGATDSVFQASAGGNYQVRVSNSSGCSIISATTALQEISVPVANIAATTDTVICAGSSAGLFTTANGSYEWLRNGAAISGATSSSYAASQAGTYQVVVTNSNGCADTSRIITVIDQSALTANATAIGNTTVCAGETVELAATTGVGLSYHWLRNGSAINGATDTIFSATQTGDYSLRITTGNGCTATSAPVSVTVISIPQASIAAATDTVICAGSSAILNTNTSGSYEWLRNGSIITGAVSSSFSATLAGAYQVVVTNSNGCSDTSRVMTVTDNSIASVTIGTPLAFTFCTGDSVELKATANANWQYQWQLNGVDIPGATDSVLYAATGGNYQVQVSNSSGCTAISQTIVLSETAVPVATILAGSDTTFCPGGSVNLFTTTSGSYQWLHNGTVISGATGASNTATAGGDYQVVITNTNGCNDTSRVMTVTIDSIAAATITVSGATTFCVGDSVMLSAGTGAGLSYEWFHNGLAITGATADSIWVSQGGNYSVRVSNSLGCSQQAQPVQIQVNPLPVASIIQNGFSLIASTGNSYQWYRNGVALTGAVNQVLVPDSVGNYTVEVTQNGCSVMSVAVNVTTVGIDEQLTQAQINVYPNPTTELFQVELENNYHGEVTLQLYDMTGRIVQRQTLQKQAEKLQTKLQVENLPTGLYMLQIQQGKQQVMEKLSVKR